MILLLARRNDRNIVWWSVARPIVVVVALLCIQMESWKFMPSFLMPPSEVKSVDAYTTGTGTTGTSRTTVSIQPQPMHRQWQLHPHPHRHRHHSTSIQSVPRWLDNNYRYTKGSRWNYRWNVPTGTGSNGSYHNVFHPNKRKIASQMVISMTLSSSASTIIVDSNNDSTDQSHRKLNKFRSTVSNFIPQTIQQQWKQRVPNIKKTMKIMFYASFLIDATLLLWGGRQAIVLFLSSCNMNGNVKFSMTTWASTMFDVIRYHIVPILIPLYKSWKPILRSILFVSILYAWYDMHRTQQRQIIDPTSEWERYAQYPMSRTMAISQIGIVHMIPLYIQLWTLQQLRYFLSRTTRTRTTTTTTKKYDTQITSIKERMGYTFADGLLRIGPLYIKMGQILSCREDLFPKEWMIAMERLQDQVPARTGIKAQQLAYAIWPDGQESFDRTFSHVNWTPIAAASLGQVHSATLRHTDERVALKLQRPKLRTIYTNDLQLLKKIAVTVDRFFGSSAGSVGGIQQSWTSIFTDAEEILFREIDYRSEGQNAIRFSNDFGLSKGGYAAPISTTTTTTAATTATSRDGQPLPSAASWLRTPYVYDTLSTEQVLVMEYVPSIKISAIDKLIQANVTISDREYLADCLGRSYLRQFCCNKFFSTDPHAGNLGVEILNMKSNQPEERVRLVYYDFGQATELQPNQADGILDIIEAIVDMDVDKSIESFRKMGVLKDDADLNAVRDKVADNYRSGKVKANRKKLTRRNYQFKESTSIDSITTIVSSNITTNDTTNNNASSTSNTKVTQYFTLPAEYVFVGRALSQMDGVGKTLDSEFDFISAAAPYIVEIKGTQKYVQDEVSKWMSKLCDNIRSVLNLDKFER